METLFQKNQPDSGATLFLPAGYVSTQLLVFVRSVGNGDRCLYGGLGQKLSPWNLVGRILSQVLNQSVQELVLVAQVRIAQSWYTMLCKLLVRKPLLIPQLSYTIQSVCQNKVPDITPDLAVWIVSGIDARVANFQKQLHSLSCLHGETNPQVHANS